MLLRAVFPLAVLLVVSTTAAPAADLIDVLPGWDGPLPSKMYAGFVSAGSEPGYTMWVPE